MLSSLNKFQMSCKCPSKNDCERWGSAAQRTCIAQSKLDSLAQPSLMAARYVTWVKAHVERLKSMRSEFYSMDIDNNARTTKRDPRNTSGLGRSKLRSYFSSFGTKVQTQYACAGDCSLQHRFPLMIFFSFGRYSQSNMPQTLMFWAPFWGVAPKLLT